MKQILSRDAASPKFGAQFTRGGLDCPMVEGGTISRQNEQRRTGTLSNAWVVFGEKGNKWVMCRANVGAPLCARARLGAGEWRMVERMVTIDLPRGAKEAV